MVPSIRIRPSFPHSQSFPFYCFPSFRCIDHWGRLSYLSLLFFGTLHSNGNHKNHNHRKLTNLITWTIALSNSMKLWAMSCRATQDGWVIVESSDKTWSTGEGNGKPLQYSCLENPINSMKRQKDRTLKDELPRSVGAQYATGDEWRNNSRKNEGMEPKQKQNPVVDVTGNRSKVRCCKEQYCTGTWMLGPWIKANWK